MKRFVSVLPVVLLLVPMLLGPVSGQAYSVYGLPRLFLTGDTAPGGTFRMVYNSPFDKNKSYAFFYSSGTNNPYVLPDGRSTGINVYLPGNAALDPIFAFTAFNGLGGEAYFGTPLPQSGTLNIVGAATKAVTLPNVGGLPGLTIYCVALTLNPASPSGVERISNVVAITFRNPATTIHYIRIQNLPGVPGWNGTQSGTVGGIVQGTTSGMCRIKPLNPPPPGKGGLEEHTEMFEVRGYNNGPNGVSENGGGDDINLGPVPCTFSENITGANVGSIDADTGLFTAGNLASTAANGAAGAFGTVTATLVGNPALTHTKQIRVVPPDWVSPPLTPPANLMGQVVSNQVVLTWTNPVAYTTIDVRRNGVIIASGLPGNTTTYTDTLNNSGSYGVRGIQGGSISNWVTVNIGTTPLTLGDDSNVVVSIGFGFTIYGTLYTQMFVNSNGNITFGGGDNDYTETAGELASGLRRICGAWDDLNPGAGGVITSNPTATTHQIVFSGVPEFSTSNSNSFTMEVRSNGQIQLLWASLALLDCIVGISPGGNISTAAEVNFNTVALPYTGAANARIYEQFTGGADPFDLNGLSRTFTPIGNAYQMTSP